MIQQIYPPVNHHYMYELNKDFHFAAAHFVPTHEAGACANIHGHTYFVNVTVAGNELNNEGFLVNFADIKKLIHKRYDHTLLNEHDEFTEEFDSEPYRYPTTEVVARTIWETVENYLAKQPNRPRCLQVFLRETPTSYIVFRPRG